MVNVVWYEQLRATGGGINMEDRSAEASEPIDDVVLEISQDMGNPVKGTGRPDLDENEEDDSIDVADQASLLSEFEDEDYVSEVVVGSLPLVISEGDECAPSDKSPRREAGKPDNRDVEARVSTEEESSSEEASSVEHNVYGDRASPIVSSSLTEERNIPPWEAFSETNFLSESDEDVLFGPAPVASVHFERSSNKCMEGAFGEGPVKSVTAGPLSPACSGTLTGEQNNQPLQTPPKTKPSSESGEDSFDPRANAKVQLKQTSGIGVDTLGTSVSKLFIPEAGEGMPQALPSPKLDPVGDVMLRLGSKHGPDFGADGLEVDSKFGAKLDVKDTTTRRKGTIMRLGSKEAEELLQLDLTKMGRAILPSVKKGGTGAKSPISNGVGWGVEDLGPDEVMRSSLLKKLVDFLMPIDAIGCLANQKPH